MKPISKIALSIAPSATMAIDAIAKQMKADGINVIGFGAGEPDFDTPDNIKQAGINAINNNQTRYTPASGTLALKKAIALNLKNYGLEYEPSQICVSSGAKHNIFVALQAIINPGDEVILPAPYWVSYYEAIRMAGGVPVIAETTEETGFKMSPEQFEAAVTDKTKCLILTNPSNPTGMLYSKEAMQALADVVLKHDLYVISDEIYCELVYTGEFFSFPAISPEMKERTILINGVSKTYAMTGWRIGYSAANHTLTKAMSNYLSHSTGNPSSVSQVAALAAISQDQQSVKEMKKAFETRRNYFLERISKIDDVSCLEPEGAFYIFMNIKPLLGRTFYGEQINSSENFAKVFLEKGLVAVVPGSAFGAEGYLRWSYATSMENIKEGLDRLEHFLKG